MDVNEIIGWTGNGFFIVGTLFLSCKNTFGWYCNFIGNLLYVIQSINMNNNSLLMLSIWLCAMNLYGIYKWRQVHA